MAFNEILDTRYKTVKVQTSGPNYVESCQLAELGKCNSHNRPSRDICRGDLLMYLVIPIPSIFNSMSGLFIRTLRHYYLYLFHVRSDIYQFMSLLK